MRHKRFLSLVLLLAGCIGSSFDDRSDVDAPFPSLHSVPDRPRALDHYEQTQVDTEMGIDQQKMLDANHDLRAKFEVSPPTSCKEDPQEPTS